MLADLALVKSRCSKQGNAETEDNQGEEEKRLRTSWEKWHS